jgi:hypothetical protein
VEEHLVEQEAGLPSPLLCMLVQARAQQRVQVLLLSQQVPVRAQEQALPEVPLGQGQVQVPPVLLLPSS